MRETGEPCNGWKGNIFRFESCKWGGGAKTEPRRFAACLSFLFLLFTPLGLAADESVACKPEPTDEVVEYGTLVTCTLEVVGDTDLFRFAGKIGEVVIVYVADGSTLSFVNVRFDLFGPDGQPVGFSASNSIQPAVLTTELAQTGLYTILISEQVGDEVLDYRLTVDRIAPRSPAAPFVCFGCEASEMLNAQGDVDLYAFDGKMGDVVFLRIIDDSGLSFANAQIELFGPSGAFIETVPSTPDDSAGQILANLNETGSYTVVVSEVDGQEAVGYTLSLQCIAGPCLSLPVNCAAQGGPVSDLRLGGGRTAKLGELVAFSFIVFNIGDTEAPDVVLRNSLPKSTSFVSAVAGQGLCSESGGEVICSLGSLPVGEAVEVSISVRVLESLSGLLVNAAEVESPQCDPDASNNQARVQLDLSPIDGQVDLVFPQIVDGDACSTRFQTSLILANTGEDSRLRVDFFQTPDGLPMELTLQGLGLSSSFEFELAKGESAVLETPGTDQLRIGYARVRGGHGLEGVLVFKQVDTATGVTLLETGVPATEPLANFSVFVDSIGHRDSGVALVNPRPDSGQGPTANLTLRLYDSSFELVGESTLSLASGGHLARFAHEFFNDPEVTAKAREMRGLLTMSSDQPLLAVTLRQTDDPNIGFPADVPALTTFPVIPGRPIP